MKRVIIIGAGPAGLTAAYELLKKNKYEIYILEKENCVGGLSKSFEFLGNRVDIGGHRFFTRNEKVQALWDEVLPVEDGKMTLQHRKSDIFFRGKFIPYPIKVCKELVEALGIRKSVCVVTSYIGSIVNQRHERSLEEFYINRFGKVLYECFFKDYTYKLWGIPARNILPIWGRQRIEEISLKKIICNFFGDKEVSKSEITKFYYPSFGCGQIWKSMASKCEELGAKLILEAKVNKISITDKRVAGVSYTHGDTENALDGDIIISSMPLYELIEGIGLSDKLGNTSEILCYRDMITVSISFYKKYAGDSLKKCERDTWIYLQDKSVRAGRLQILNNWSKNAVPDEETYLLQLEYYCDEHDDFWLMSDESWVSTAKTELEKCNFIQKKTVLNAALVSRIEKAYPVYNLAYKKIQDIWSELDLIEGLYCTGRNGRHIYGNMDQVMECSIAIVDALENNTITKGELWRVEQNDKYIEENICTAK